MSKYVPDDLKNMSKKELLEVALIMHEENVKLVQAKHKESLETISDYVLELMQSANIENFSTNRLSTSDGRSIELTLRYVDGETPADQLTRYKEQNAQLLEYLEDAHAHIGHLASHLAGRIADGARFEMAKRADEWREYCEKLLGE